MTGHRADVTNILIVGVGGQGILFSAGILAQLLVEKVFDVKEAEVHGMAQRGGSVHSMIRFGKEVHSPLIYEGEVDFLVSFEALEALRWAPFARPEAKIIVAGQRIDPLPVALGLEKYPVDIEKKLKKTFREVKFVDALDLAKKAGDVRAANIVMLGALVKNFPFSQKRWLEVIEQRVPPKILGVNRRAFELGWKS
ncbi:MAG: indolepyruvate oxidoreductase subunit beta [Actinomycetota bacterium]